jgi:hypothetical protein
MKKLNKILMMTVSILLSLVLLTSAVVSSTFAKYVITKNATSTVTLTKYNMTITMTKGTSTNVPALTETKKKGDSIEYTMTGVTLKPGDNYSNLISASISGTPAAKSNIIITVDVKNVKINDDSIDTAPFKVPNANFSTLKLGADKAYLPLAIYVNNTSVLAAYTSYDYTATVIEETIENAIGNAIKDKSTANTYVTSKAYTRVDSMAKVTAVLANTSKKATWSGLSFGFEWPKNVGGSMDEVGTWIAKACPSFDIVYKITVEQQP